MDILHFYVGSFYTFKLTGRAVNLYSSSSFFDDINPAVRRRPMHTHLNVWAIFPEPVFYYFTWPRYKRDDAAIFSFFNLVRLRVCCVCIYSSCACMW